MKSKLTVAALMLALPALAYADQHGHHGHYRGGHGGNNWIAPAIIGGAIVGSAIYGVTRDDPPVVVERQYQRPLTSYEMREEQLRQREYELERREHEYYERQHRSRDYNDDDNCREYYRSERGGSYYSKNCW